MTWKAAIKNKTFQAHIIIAGLGLGGLVGFLPYFFQQIILPKQGVQLNDFVLNAFAPADYSLPIFLLIYAGIITMVMRLAKDPVLFLTGIEAYLLLNIFRAITLTLFTLEPPEGIIPLIDPFVSRVAYGASVFNKDLFFSGHTSTLILLLLLEKEKLWRWMLLGLTLIVAFLLIKQRVHYTVDILAAPFAAWVAVSTARFFTRTLN